jgi:hypothetical protein
MSIPFTATDIEDLNQRCQSWFKRDWKDLQQEVETNKEKTLIDLLWKLGIQSSVKTDKKSLPYQHTVTIHKGFNSFVNDIAYTEELYRKLIKHLLEEDTYKIRFFVETEPWFGTYENTSYITGITYHIKYYIHKR